ncbi:MAG: hypothetical protein U0V73_12895 [Acidimicrobiia bacterium]
MSRTAVRRALASVALATVAACSPVSGGGPRTTRRTASVHAVALQGAGAVPDGSQLVDHGGAVLAAPHLYTIWWGSPGAFPADAHTAVASFFAGLPGSGYLQLAGQYLRGAPVGASPAATFDDASAPPVRTGGPALVAEIAKLTHRAPDPAGVYFVFTANAPSRITYCGLHDSARIGGNEVAYVYLPNPSGRIGCTPRVRLGANGFTEATQAWVNIAAHELLEAMTDARPLGDAAWLDDAGMEIGDKCAWRFAAPVTLSNGTRWQLQTEWSNRQGGCAQG